MSTINTITTVYNSFNDVQLFEKLENEREQTMLDPNYQKWMSELNVSRSYVEPSGYIRAKELNSQYDYSNLSPKSSFLNFLKIKGIW
jgi:hypothetical protein